MEMHYYEVTLGVDRAARDTGRRMTIQVTGYDALSAALKAEAVADTRLKDPGVEYTHAMRVRPVIQPPPVAVAMPVPLAMAA
jgi:hypothetical protein